MVLGWDGYWSIPVNSDVDVMVLCMSAFGTVFGCALSSLGLTKMDTQKNFYDAAKINDCSDV